ncbi:MAG: hypothetical protein RLZZ245_3843 [Verrucomicrobiota bacterium]
MLQNRGAQPVSEKAHLIATQEKHVGQMLATLRASGRVEFLEVDFPSLVSDPETSIGRVRRFLGDAMTGNLETLAAMVRPELYRNRAQP